MNENEIRQILDTLHIQMNKGNKESNRYSFFRFLLLIVVLGSIYYGYHAHSSFYIVMAIALICFLYFVRKQKIIKKDIEFYAYQKTSYEDVLLRKAEGWKKFEDQGMEFLSDEYTQAFDLDIFGNASLFQYLCVAKTIFGREQLASLLCCHKVAHKDIKRRQGMIEELSKQSSFVIDLTSHLKMLADHGRKKKKSNMEAFYTYMEDEQRIYANYIHSIVTGVSMLFWIALLCAILVKTSSIFPLVLGVISISLALLSVLKNAVAFQDISSIENTLQDYESIFLMLQKTNFDNNNLKQLLCALEDTPNAIKKLHRISNAIHFRNDGILFLMTNALFLLDFQCVFALEKWKKQYGRKVRIWMQLLGELEAYCSLAQLPIVKNNCCFPTCLKESEPSIKMQNSYHPLIMEEQAVSNSFVANANSYVITGSNMSGKTTFLRTIGLNMVLFHAGSAVCAESFQASSMDIFTSMRIKDDVSEGISTFYAEILRIKVMIEKSKQKQPMLVLIDEIFKGTNSADRIVCAKEVLSQIHKPWTISIVSTHDFELCSLTFHSHQKAINYHFSEYYEEQKICFDYLLKKDRCETTNAKELLEMAGIHMNQKRIA